MSYTVHMWLTCTSSTPEAIEEFAKRWTSALQAAWASFTSSAPNLNALADELNEKILNDCGQKIADDMTGGNLAAIDSVQALSSAGWTPIGGHHSGSHAVNVVPTTGPTLQWCFPAAQVKVYINVCLTF